MCGAAWGPWQCRYQAVDWRKQGNWACNQRLNPTGDFYFDGVTLSPYELMFVKVPSWAELSCVAGFRTYSACAVKQVELCCSAA